MDLTPEDVDELVAGLALDGLDEQETARIERLIGDDPELAARAAALREVVALLGASTATAPPMELRSNVLRASAGAGPRPLEPSDALTLLLRQIEALDELVPTLDDTDWRRRADPYRWSVHGLIAHLLVIERYAAGRLGLMPVEDDSGPTGHLQLGAATIELEQSRPYAETYSSWHDRATSTVTALRKGGGPAFDAFVDFHGYLFTVESLLIARAFEIWTHADDIRRAVGRDLLAPVPKDLRAMSHLSVTSLPLALGLTAPDSGFEGARVVLTGDGGATFDLGDPARRSVIVVADVVDYCRLAARRLTIDELDPVIEGDNQLAGLLLHAAQVFAI